MNKMEKAFENSKDDFRKEYACYGIRRQEAPFESDGETMVHNSCIWADGEETAEELDGVCALSLDRFDTLSNAINASRMYYGDYVAIIASNSYEYGQDLDEVILRDPVVIAAEKR